MVVFDIHGEPVGQSEIEGLSDQHPDEGDHRLASDETLWPRDAAPPDAIWRSVGPQELDELGPLEMEDDDVVLILSPFDSHRGAGPSSFETWLAATIRVTRNHAVVALLPKHFLSAKRYQRTRSLIAQSRMPQLIVDGQVDDALTEWAHSSLELAVIVFAAENQHGRDNEVHTGPHAGLLPTASLRRCAP